MVRSLLYLVTEDTPAIHISSRLLLYETYCPLTECTKNPQETVQGQHNQTRCLVCGSHLFFVTFYCECRIHNQYGWLSREDRASLWNYPIWYTKQLLELKRAGILGCDGSKGGYARNKGDSALCYGDVDKFSADGC